CGRLGLRLMIWCRRPWRAPSPCGRSVRLIIRLRTCGRPSFVSRSMRNARSVEASKRRSAARAARVADRESERADEYPSDLADLWRVSAKERAVLFLTVIEGCSYREAADAVGCSEPAARQMASRALRSLREYIGADLHGGDRT